MGLPFNRLQYSCILLLLFVMAGCSSKPVFKRPEGRKDFVQETFRLEKLALDHPEASVRAQSHLQLAFLYVNYRNPQLNYTRALRQMEAYFSLARAKVETDDFRNWFAVLQKVETLQISLRKVQEANKSLRDEMSSLKEMNYRMRETIETLKNLDREMEEKRNITK